MTVGRWIMVTAVGVMVMSQIVDWLEPTFGLSFTTLLIAADIVLALASGCAIVAERRWTAARARLWRQVSLHRSGFVNGLCAISAVLLILIALAHQQDDPRLDAWLAVVGALLLPLGGFLATRDHRRRR